MASISELLQRIGNADDVPTEALVALVGRFDEAAPALRDLLDKAARGRPLSDADATVFFYGLHVLAAARDRQSFPALLQFLRRTNEEIDNLLGDAVFTSLSKIVIGLFNDDADLLFTAAIDKRLDDVLRDAFIAAATFLTWDGRIGRERMYAFLTAFEDTPPPDGDMGWYSWVQAITHLGLRDLMPRAERAFATDRLPEDAVEWSEIDQDLRDAERAPSDPERFSAVGLGYPDDVIETLGWIERADDGDPPDEPVINPYRDVGRNDPCPCGSGKKFKKCCLAEAADIDFVTGRSPHK